MGSTTNVRPPSSSTKASRCKMKRCFHLSRPPPSSPTMIPKQSKRMRRWGTSRRECQIKLTVRRQRTRPLFRRSGLTLTNLSMKMPASRIACCNQSGQLSWVIGSSEWLRYRRLRDARFRWPLLQSAKALLLLGKSSMSRQKRWRTLLKGRKLTRRRQSIVSHQN